MREIICPYCGRKFAIDITQIEESEPTTPGMKLNIQIDKVTTLSRYHIRKKDGRKLPYLPYPLSRENITKELSEYEKVTDEYLKEIVEVKGKIDGRAFTARIWHFDYIDDENLPYNYMAYVIAGRFSGGPTKLKDVKYVEGNKELLRIPPSGFSSKKKERHKLNADEIKEIMPYIESFASIDPSGEIIMTNSKPLSNQEFLKKLITIWFAFYGRFL